MTSMTFGGRILTIEGRPFLMSHEIREAFIVNGKIIVLIDPSSYLNDSGYSKDRRRGVNPLKNLLALSINGNLLWEAEFPGSVDYFYSIESRIPLIVKSFSSYRCKIDLNSGRIISQEFYK